MKATVVHNAQLVLRLTIWAVYVTFASGSRSCLSDRVTRDKCNVAISYHSNSPVGFKVAQTVDKGVVEHWRPRIDLV